MRAALAGGTAPAILNAADEVAVQAFLDGAIRLGDVPGLLAHALDTVPAAPAQTLPAIEAADRDARAAVTRELARRGAGVAASDGRA